MLSIEKCCSACKMTGHKCSNHRSCPMNRKNCTLLIPQKRTSNVVSTEVEYPAESSRSTNMRVRRESPEDQVVLQEATSPVIPETESEKIESEKIDTVDTDIKPSDDSEESDNDKEEIVVPAAIVRFCPTCHREDHRHNTNRLCPFNSRYTRNDSSNQRLATENIARLPALCEPEVDNKREMNVECSSCRALMWMDKRNGKASLRNPTFSMCCGNRTSVLPSLEPTPPAIAELLNNRTRDEKQFLSKIRSYNGTLSFTSLGANIDHSVANNKSGAYNFQIHRTVCHRIGSITPSQVQHWQHQASYLSREVLEKLQSVLEETNPFISLFRSMEQVSHNNGHTADLTLRLIAEGPQNQRQYNAPTTNEVAVLIMNNDICTTRDIVLHTHTNDLQSINDRLMYCCNSQHHLHLFGHLFQQFIVDMYVKVEHNRLHYINANQDRLRVDIYSGIQDAISLNDNDIANIRKKVILLSSFIGSPRHMRQLYQDAMSIVHHFGKPDLFITFTCNPIWPEITSSLLSGQKANG
ncbi:hypothetical protein PHYBLDRAFT_137847 [Phycomyces blakesleeanus NRRL 1555(-)]|uniref:Helitron helicase-like domain-containing protein n=1 Tax=Phycomyces blakesleeanus (strain ATCC 8743b / DSM 1359 / FGSC 10004 / NBRC 33097 / NRRL 1555) TaxID=763407 RepID=A0A162YF42_PHYB8|nr:hypothetical protein PHYBLDRAFT_137847 [Phycomyces blakesleeanus NRRL 1555(-)]OAD80295.1 hypothetical protein PHYBLDRAFT_137847 [Phycomyces blakesleeanus NRRL 1555(-)]|eukprot:XP_018298335.1 hypothetical protein PHYBLDRAFT_137847 [Phycomyces blakesleeanus NRRL 1555(-)]